MWRRTSISIAALLAALAFVFGFIFSEDIQGVGIHKNSDGDGNSSRVLRAHEPYVNRHLIDAWVAEPPTRARE